MGSTVLKESFLKLEYSVKVSNEMTNDSYISNFKGETIFSIHFWGLLPFCQISREGSINYLFFFFFFGGGGGGGG
jgi:hypothetical protein